MRLLIAIFTLCTVLITPSFALAADFKIVSLAPNWSHTVAELGAIDSLVGVTRYARFPDEIPKRVERDEIAVVGGFTDITLKKIAALEPDLVLSATGLQLKLKAQLEQNGFKVIHMEESSLKEVFDKINQLGDAIGHQNQANKLISSIKSELIDIKQEYQGKYDVKPNVYYEINYYYKCVPGSDSYMKELIELTGAQAILSDRQGIAPAVTWEEVVTVNPDVILLPMWPGAEAPSFSGPTAGNGTTTFDEVISRHEASKVNAVVNDAIFYIDSAITKQAGPSIPAAARLLAETIYRAYN
ncbi:ABC transporter substrate-binding protein [Shewanella sp. KT0246]|uniref:ABC transporter substrate-binding protein n=1 Tax=Shewanella sp. KT0246 TaxID=2815912 RepID=UPI001BB8884B|nr:helical backbone metal receptor [Shewanella sp. KT0246]GIU48516.1 hypothetical protein TUM4249_04000 [Shewanella sp. KT0246]